MQDMNAKQAKATMTDIAGYTGLPVSTVRRDCRMGKFDMDDFMSVMQYVLGYVLIERAVVTEAKKIDWRKK